MGQRTIYSVFRVFLALLIAGQPAGAAGGSPPVIRAGLTVTALALMRREAIPAEAVDFPGASFSRAFTAARLRDQAAQVLEVVTRRLARPAGSLHVSISQSTLELAGALCMAAGGGLALNGYFWEGLFVALLPILAALDRLRSWVPAEGPPHGPLFNEDIKPDQSSGDGSDLRPDSDPPWKDFVFKDEEAVAAAGLNLQSLLALPIDAQQFLYRGLRVSVEGAREFAKDGMKASASKLYEGSVYLGVKPVTAWSAAMRATAGAPERDFMILLFQIDRGQVVLPEGETVTDVAGTHEDVPARGILRMFGLRSDGVLVELTSDLLPAARARTPAPLTPEDRRDIRVNVREHLRKIVGLPEREGVYSAGNSARGAEAALLEALHQAVQHRVAEFLSAELSEEERLDAERAQRRLSIIGRIGDGLAVRYPDLFDRYVLEVAAPMLGMPVRELNLLLASTATARLRHLLAALERGARRRSVTDELQGAVRSRKYWLQGPTTYKEDERFYLSGFPIVVENRGFLDQDGGREKLHQAGQLLRESGWLDLHPGAMRHTETIYIEVGDDLSSDLIPEGRVRGLGHHDVKVRRDLGADHVAETLVHEDSHHEIEQDPRFKAILAFEKANRIRTVPHHWIGSYYSHRGRPSRLLAELRCYGLDTDLTLHLWRWRKRSPVDDLPAAGNEFDAERTAKKVLAVFGARESAAEAVKVLRRHPRRLNAEGLAWLDEWEREWARLDAEIQPYWEQLLDALLASPDRDVRILGFLYTENAWEADPSRRAVYEKRLDEALSREEDPYLLSLAQSTDYDVFEVVCPKALVSRVAAARARVLRERRNFGLDIDRTLDNALELGDRYLERPREEELTREGYQGIAFEQHPDAAPAALTFETVRWNDLAGQEAGLRKTLEAIGAELAQYLRSTPTRGFVLFARRPDRIEIVAAHYAPGLANVDNALPELRARVLAAGGRLLIESLGQGNGFEPGHTVRFRSPYGDGAAIQILIPLRPNTDLSKPLERDRGRRGAISWEIPTALSIAGAVLAGAAVWPWRALVPAFSESVSMVHHILPALLSVPALWTVARRPLPDFLRAA